MQLQNHKEPHPLKPYCQNKNRVVKQEVPLNQLDLILKIGGAQCKHVVNKMWFLFDLIHMCRSYE